MLAERAQVGGDGALDGCRCDSQRAVLVNRSASAARLWFCADSSMAWMQGPDFASSPCCPTLPPPLFPRNAAGAAAAGAVWPAAGGKRSLRGSAGGLFAAAVGSMTLPAAPCSSSSGCVESSRCHAQLTSAALGWQHLIRRLQPINPDSPPSAGAGRVPGGSCRGRRRRRL